MKKILIVLAILSLIILVGILLYGCTKDPCKQKATSIGMCDAFFTGYQYSAETEKCEEVGLSGCNAEIPFNYLEDCQNTCENK